MNNTLNNLMFSYLIISFPLFQLRHLARDSISKLGCFFMGIIPSNKKSRNIQNLFFLPNEDDNGSLKTINFRSKIK